MLHVSYYVLYSIYERASHFFLDVDKILMSSNTKKVSDRVLLLAEWKPSVIHISAECKSVNGFIFKNCCRWIKRQLCATSHLCRILKYPPNHMRLRRRTQSFHWLMVHGGFNLKRKWNSLTCKRQVILFSFLFFSFLNDWGETWENEPLHVTLKGSFLVNPESVT